MGVKGLHGFMEAALPLSDHTLSLADLRGCSEGADVVVVDGMALYALIA